MFIKKDVLLFEYNFLLELSLTFIVTVLSKEIVTQERNIIFHSQTAQSTEQLNTKRIESLEKTEKKRLKERLKWVTTISEMQFDWILCIIGRKVIFYYKKLIQKLFINSLFEGFVRSCRQKNQVPRSN